MKLTQTESILCQALAMTSLLNELSNEDFLNSEYYKNLYFKDNNNNFKEILNDSGLGNPATIQMFLYALLVMPKEIFENSKEPYIKCLISQVNNLFQGIVHELETTYDKESKNDFTTINFCRHIRNAVSHSRCYYEVKDNVSYVTFEDSLPKDTKKYCKITMKTGDVGSIIGELKILIMKFLNECK